MQILKMNRTEIMLIYRKMFENNLKKIQFFFYAVNCWKSGFEKYFWEQESQNRS